jgi:hypothetical protein
MEIYTNREVYSEVRGEKKAQRQAKKSTKERKRPFQNILNNPLVKGAIGGGAQAIQDWSRNPSVEFQTQGNTTVDTSNTDEGKKLPPVEKTKEPMSTTTKVFIGLGIATAIGLGVYFGFFHKKKGKATTSKKK